MIDDEAMLKQCCSDDEAILKQWQLSLYERSAYFGLDLCFVCEHR